MQNIIFNYIFIFFIGIKSINKTYKKGIWSQNHDRMLKITCQMEQMGSYTPEEENEITEMEQQNVQVGKQGVIMDENGNQELNEVFNNLTIGKSLESVVSEEGDLILWLKYHHITETITTCSRIKGCSL